MTKEFKEQVDVAIGKVVATAKEQKEKLADFLDEKQALYEAKTDLDEAKKKADELFFELGKAVFYKSSTNKSDIINNIRLTLESIELLQDRYNELRSSDEEQPTYCSKCGTKSTSDSKFCYKCGSKLKK